MEILKQADLVRLHGAAEEASKLLKVIANRDRLVLLCQMTREECSVSELEAMTGVQQPTLSQQLTVLRNKGLVNTRRDGKQIYYSIASNEVQAVLQVLYQLYCPKE